MAKTGKFYHEVQSLTDVPVTNAFVVAQRSDINLYDTSIGSSPKAIGSTFAGRLEGMVIRLKSIAGGAAKLTVKITHSATGSQIVIPDTEADIALEVGTLTEGGVAYSFDFAHLHTDDDLHIFYKTDLGTCTVDALEFYWSE